jgi:hypothetical protein
MATSNSVFFWGGGVIYLIYLNLYVQNLGKSTTSKKLNQKYESGLTIDF